MKDDSFGFDVEQSKEMNAEQTRNSIITDIENYWGHECLATSASFTLTLS